MWIWAVGESQEFKMLSLSSETLVVEAMVLGLIPEIIESTDSLLNRTRSLDYLSDGNRIFSEVLTIAWP